MTDSHMKKDTEHIQAVVDDRVERLISRCRDGDLAAGEQSELDRILALNPAARNLFEEYRQNDLIASEALSADMGRTVGQTPASPRRTLWLAAAGAVLAAAAVVALSFLPVFEPNGQRLAGVPYSPPIVERSPIPNSRLVEYGNVNHDPMRQLGDVRRDFIGIRSSDPNVIYVFDRKTQSATYIPVSRDF